MFSQKFSCAEDTIFFSLGEKREVDNLLSLLRIFELVPDTRLICIRVALSV